MAIYNNDRDPNEIMWENQTKPPIAKQTAVEFLVELLPQIDWDDPYYRGILQEAKDMEKEQITEAFTDGCHIKHKPAADQYYKTLYEK